RARGGRRPGAGGDGRVRAGRGCRPRFLARAPGARRPGRRGPPEGPGGGVAVGGEVDAFTEGGRDLLAAVVETGDGRGNPGAKGPRERPSGAAGPGARGFLRGRFLWAPEADEHEGGGQVCPPVIPGEG